ncbi:MAG: tannase/feruloyl esterase family alpha/beta hydrolase [Novosphingobium sp.]|nr:tannase/feruloyl esterase family alpha/beta hydrolase [Novosphingobium sp.]
MKSATLVPATTFLPEYCLVKGEITSVDPTAQPITFLAAFPTQWNKKLMQLGGGGWDGYLPDVTSDYNTGFRIATGPGSPVPLARGYVVMGDDSGHFGASSGPAGATMVSLKAGVDPLTWTLNDEMLHNFAHEHLKKAHDTVVALIKMRYAEPLRKTYFEGASRGGGEAMLVVQRYPADYDGVYAAMPSLGYVPAGLKRQQIGRAMRANGGVGWISPAKAMLLYNAQITACDGLDGVRDGLISNVKACTFDPATLRCPDGREAGDKCLSDAQLATIRIMFSRTSWNYDLAHGVRSAPAYLPGAALVSLLNTVGTTAQYSHDFVSMGNTHALGDAFIRAVILRNLDANTLSFDTKAPGKYLASIQKASALFDATNPDIRAFIRRGGKLIIVHGLADPLPMPTATTEYYDNLVTRFGQSELDKSVRYYTVPGYGHGGGPFDVTHGGPRAYLDNPDSAVGGTPVLDALENWVENGVAPGNLIATAGTRTRPLCVYPAWPKYKGTGNVDQAANFDCVH